MRFSVLLFAFASVARCQLPNLALVGGEYNSSSSPHFSGFVALAMPVSQPAALYSYSMYQALVVKGKLTTSTTTGVADDLKTFCFKPGCLVVVGLAAAGVATSTAAQLAAATGGGLLYRWKSGWAAAAFVVQNTTGGTTKPAGLIGLGKTW